jgi:hypothetical protein
MDACRLLVVAAFLSAFFGPKPCAAADPSFTLEVLSQDHIDWPSLAIDAQDQIHLAYYYWTNTDHGLEYRRKSAGGWVVETLPATMGYYGSLALDPSGTPHLSYFDPAGADLAVRYATRTGSGWIAETVAIAGAPGITMGKTSLAFDAQGTPQVAFCVDQALRFAQKSANGWLVETLDTNGAPQVGRYPSLQIDSQGDPYIAYSDDSRLVLAHKAENGWQFETVDSGGGLYPSLALDASGNASISYFGSGQSVLKYAHHDASGWSIETPGAGALSSLVLDANGNPCISYQDNSGILKYATKSNGGWTTQTVDGSELSGSRQSLALDSMGRPSVAYEFHTRYSRQVALRYAHADLASGVEVTNRARTWFSPVSPSPSRGSIAQLAFRLARREVVTVQLFDVRGRLVALRPSQTYDPGEHAVQWDTGSHPAGMYFLRLQTQRGESMQQRWTRLR